MMADFQTGDPYVAFGIRAGVLPPGATKETHRETRDMLKACVLGLQYGMGEQTLAIRIGKPTIVARELVWAHRDRYRKFWRMAEGAVDCAMLGLPISTVFGWHVRAGSGLIKPRKVGDRPRSAGRSMLNFPMQANGAEMMQLCARRHRARHRGVRARTRRLPDLRAAQRIAADVAGCMRLAMDERRVRVLTVPVPTDRQSYATRINTGQAQRHHVATGNVLLAQFKSVERVA
jgi:hypothetical protein